MKRLAALASIAIAAAIPASASAAEQQATASTPVAYTTPQLVAFEGDTLRFTNLDALAGHDLDSVPAGRFGSPVVTAGDSTPVSGVSSLEPGTYRFHCSIHPVMTGQLRVLEAPGGPGAPPDPPPLPEPPDPGSNPLDLVPRVPAEPLGPGEWPSYGRDLSNSRNGGTAGPSPLEAVTLGPVWSFASSDGDYTGTPVVAGGTLYAGSSGGTLTALDAATGAVRWSHDFDKPINASAAVSGGIVYIPLVQPGAPSVAALDAATGAVLWETVTDTQPTADSYGSPTLYDGKLFIGTSGYFGESVSEVDVQARGSIVALDAATGALLWKTYTVPEGHDGGAVWSTAAVDPEADRLYVGTGNAYHEPVGDMTDSMLAVDPDDGTILDHFQAVAGDAWNGAEDSLENPDADFGASANLFTGPDGTKLVGQGQKNGIYTALDRATMGPVWRTQIGPGSFMGGIIGSTAVDAEGIYGPATQGGEMWSLGLGGALRWLSTDGGPVLHFGAVSTANGVVYSNDVTGIMTARDAATGAILARLPLGAPSWAGVSVAGGSVFTATGTGGTAGYIVAFRPRD